MCTGMHGRVNTDNVKVNGAATEKWKAKDLLYSSFSSSYRNKLFSGTFLILSANTRCNL